MADDPRERNTETYSMHNGISIACDKIRLSDKRNVAVFGHSVVHTAETLLPRNLIFSDEPDPHVSHIFIHSYFD